MGSHTLCSPAYSSAIAAVNRCRNDLRRGGGADMRCGGGEGL